MTTLLIWLAILLIAIVLWRINRRPMHHTQPEVAAILNSLLAGTTGSREWAYFISIRLDNPQLEDIRARCAALFRRGSPSIRPGAEEPQRLTALGKQQVAALLAECEALRPPAAGASAPADTAVQQEER